MPMCANAESLRVRERHDGVVGNRGNSHLERGRAMTEMWELWDLLLVGSVDLEPHRLAYALMVLVGEILEGMVQRRMRYFDLCALGADRSGDRGLGVKLILRELESVFSENLLNGFRCFQAEFRSGFRRSAGFGNLEIRTLGDFGSVIAEK